MERMTKAEIDKAVEIVMGEVDTTPDRARRVVNTLHGMALRMANLNERMCNEPLGELGEQLWTKLAADIRAVAAAAGLGVYLNGDPRGNPVGILTPKSGKFNTMGGAEAGWRL